MQDSTPTPVEETPTVATPPAEPVGELPPVVEVGMPGFRPLQDPDDGWTDRAAGGWGPGSEGGVPPGGPTGPEATGPTTETGPSRGSIGETVLKGALTVVGIATMLLHAWRTPGDDNQVWEATEEEMAGMAGPIARIVDRRVPKTIGESSDLGDAIDFGLAATVYGMRNIDEERVYKGQQGYVHHVVDTTATEAPPANGDGSADAEPPPDPLSALRGTRG